MTGTYSSTRLRPLPGSFAGLAAHKFVASGKGAVWLYDLAPGILYMQGAGHWDRRCAEAIKEFGDRHFAQRQVMVHFDDWEEVTGYDTEVRTLLTAWVLANRHLLEESNVLVRSPLVAMGLAAANIATSAVGVTMYPYRDRGAFEAALLARVRAAGQGAEASREGASRR